MNESNSNYEILKNLEEKLNFLEKREQARHTASIICISLFLLVIIICSFTVMPKLNAMLTSFSKLEKVIDTVSKSMDDVDFDSLGDAVATLSDNIDGEKLAKQFENFSALAQKLSELDVEKINSAINNINSSIESIKSTIDAIQDAIDSIPSFSDMFKSYFAKE